jgi:hypothetical protein
MHALAIMKLRLTKAVFGEEHSGSSAFHGRDEYSLSGKTIRFGRFVPFDFVMWCPAPDRITTVLRIGGLGVEFSSRLALKGCPPPRPKARYRAHSKGDPFFTLMKPVRSDTHMTVS